MSKRQKAWEYMTIDCSAGKVDPDELDEHGSHGWKLVSVVAVQTETGTTLLHYFRRRDGFVSREYV